MLLQVSLTIVKPCGPCAMAACQSQRGGTGGGGGGGGGCRLTAGLVGPSACGLCMVGGEGLFPEGAETPTVRPCKLAPGP